MWKILSVSSLLLWGCSSSYVPNNELECQAMIDDALVKQVLGGALKSEATAHMQQSILTPKVELKSSYILGPKGEKDHFISNGNANGTVTVWIDADNTQYPWEGKSKSGNAGWVRTTSRDIGTLKAYQLAFSLGSPIVVDDDGVTFMDFR